MAVKMMICDLCNKELHPLDAHMGYINSKLGTFHIDCWNGYFRKQETCNACQNPFCSECALNGKYNMPLSRADKIGVNKLKMSNGKLLLYTKQDLDTFDRLTNMESSARQMDRIHARLEWPKFSERFNKTTLDAMKQQLIDEGRW